MAVLGLDELLKRVEEEKLIENLADRELYNPEGTGFDLRIGKLYKLTSGGFLGVDKRETSKVELVKGHIKDTSTWVLLEPGQYYLMETMEKINTPLDLAPHIKHRTSLFRSGIVIYNAHVAPGYRGTLTFGIRNEGDYNFELELGARVVHVIFHKIEGETSEYRGQWQDGRVSTEGKEKQV